MLEAVRKKFGDVTSRVVRDLGIVVFIIVVVIGFIRLGNVQGDIARSSCEAVNRNTRTLRQLVGEEPVTLPIPPNADQSLIDAITLSNERSLKAFKNGRAKTVPLDCDQFVDGKIVQVGS